MNPQLHKLITLLTYSEDGAFAVALYDRVATRQEMIKAIREQVQRRVYEVTLTGSKRNPIDLIRDLKPQAGEVVCLYDIERGFPDALGYLDLQREVLADLDMSLVVWVNHYEYRELASKAPNFYAFRTATFDFTNPSEVPPPEPLFIGREQDMETMFGLLDKGGCVVLAGYGGVGKSTLALQLTRQMRSRFQETIWIGCETKPLLGDILLQIAVVLMGEGMRQIGPDEQRKRLQKVLCERPCLIVLDNFETVSEDADLLHWLQTVHAPSTVLVTSRQLVPELNAAKYELSELPTAEAVEMFTFRARQAGWQGTEADLIPRLCELVGNLPLAIELLAARADEMPIAQLITEVEKSLDALVSGDDPLRAERHQSIAACFRVSFDRLSGKAKELLKRLSILPDGASEQNMGDFTGIQNWREVADECISHSMLQFDGKRYHLHTLVGRFVSLQSNIQQEQQHLVSFFYNFVQQNDDLNDLNKLSLLEVEWRNAASAVETAEAIEDWEAVVEITTFLSDYMMRYGSWAEFEKLAIRALSASEQALGISMKSKALNNLGVVYTHQGRLAEAESCLLHDACLCRELDDMLGLSKTLNNLGNVYEKQQRWQDAETALKESLSIAYQMKAYSAAGLILINLGNIFLGCKNFHLAENAYRESLDIANRKGNYRAQRTALNNLSTVLTYLKRFQEAEPLLLQSLDSAQKYNDVFSIARCLGNLAIIREEEGDLDTAIRLCHQSLDMFEQTEDQRTQAQAKAHLLKLERKQSKKVKCRV